MPYKLKGTLKAPNGTPLIGVDIKFIAQQTFSPLLQQVDTVIRTTQSGGYDLSLEFNTYTVMATVNNCGQVCMGAISVFADTTAGQDLPTLLQKTDWQPATPDYIKQIEGWLAESNQLNNQAIASAAAAKASEIAVEADRVEVASNKTIVLNAQADITNKQAQVTASAAAAASSASSASASASTASQKEALATSAANTASQKASLAAGSEASASDSARRAEEAAQAVSSALIDGGSADLSSGTYPPPVSVGGVKRSTFWKVTVGGVVSGTDYGAGDTLIYTTTGGGSYYKIDNTESVTKVNNKTGVIVLNATDVGADVRGTSAANMGQHVAAANPHSQYLMSSEAWKISVNMIGNSVTATDLNDIRSVGRYASERASNIFLNIPSDCSPAFTLTVESISPAGSEALGYVRQTIQPYNSDKTYIRVDASNVNNNFSDWSVLYSSTNKPTAADIGADVSGTASTLINQHVAAPDPHTQYANKASMESRLAAIEALIDKVGFMKPFVSRAQLATVSALYHPLDGQLVNRSTDAGLLAKIQSGELPSCSDADWLADKYKRGMYTLGNGTTTIRLPDWNGKFSGSEGAVALRGDGKNAYVSGMIQGDSIKSHESTWYWATKRSTEVPYSNIPNNRGRCIAIPIPGLDQDLDDYTPVDAAGYSGGISKSATAIITQYAGAIETTAINTAVVWSVKR